MCAIGVNGFLSYKLKKGAWDSESFCSFVKETLAPALIGTVSSPVLVMDNCPFHKSLAVADELSRNNISVVFLPPYSPQLNPIEEFFSMIKRNFYSCGTRPKNQTEIMSKVDETLQGLDLDFTGFYRHMRKALDLCKRPKP